jgi:hypothetical protein
MVAFCPAQTVATAFVCEEWNTCYKSEANIQIKILFLLHT